MLGLVGLVALGYTLVQLLPLPIGWLERIAPRTVEILRISFRQIGGLPSTHPISLAPGRTAIEVVKLGACLLTFVVASNFLGRADRRQRFLIVTAFFAGLMATWGVIGAVVHPGRPLGLYAPKAGYTTGYVVTSFVNSNHCAAFLNLGFFLSLGLALSCRGPIRTLLLSSSVVLAVASALTLSGGGLLSLACGASLFVLLFQPSGGKQRSRWVPIRIGAFAFAAIGIFLLALFVSGEVFHELKRNWDSTGTTNKTALWPAGWRMMIANPWVGVGRGAFATTFPRYLQGEMEFATYTHLENQYLHVPIEWGVIVGGAVIVAGLLFILQCLRRCDRTPLNAAMIAALVSVGLHNAFDFNLEMLGVALPFAIVAGVLAQRNRSRSGRENGRAKKMESKVALGGVVIVVGLLAVSLFRASDQVDDQTLRQLQRTEGSLKDAARIAERAVRQQPADYYPHLIMGKMLALNGNSNAVAWINQAMFLAPYQPDVHFEAAKLLASRGASPASAFAGSIGSSPRRRGEGGCKMGCVSDRGSRGPSFF